MLAERGIQVDHVTIYRWVQRLTPLLAEAARPCRRPIGDRWWIDETYVKVGGRWRYVHRAIDQYGQVIDVYVATKRDSAAARAFFQRALTTAGTVPAEIVTDRAPVYPRLVDELAPAAWHHCEQYANNRPEADHGQLERRLRPMRHLRNDRTATGIINGHAFIQNLRRGHYNPHRQDSAEPAPHRGLRRTQPRHLIATTTSASPSRYTMGYAVWMQHRHSTVYGARHWSV